MADRVTIQDIADVLGLSRNTVSKAINNTGMIADQTREAILQKAAEMGYKQFSYFNKEGIPSIKKTADPAKNGVALFTTGRLDSSHFAATMLDKIQQELAANGYGLTIHRLLPEAIGEKALPEGFDPARTAGIVCTELFDTDYCRMLTELSVPLLFIDSPVMFADGPLHADILLMDNTACIFSFIKKMKERGFRRFGFVGEPLHCRSFYERYCAYQNALELFDLERDPASCIRFVAKTPGTYTDDQDFLRFLHERISGMDSLPEVFLCANDFVALDTLRTCRELEIHVPDDVMICGFDDATESRIITPPLTTIHIHSQSMGAAAVGVLLTRIREPLADFSTVYVATDLIWRASTRN